MITSSIQQSQRYCLFEKTLVFTLPPYSHIGFFLFSCWFYFGAMVVSYHYCKTTFDKFKFCADSNSTRSVLKFRDYETFWRWSQLEIRFNIFRWSNILQKHFIVIITIISQKKIFNISVDGEAKIITEWDRVGSINRNYPNISFLFPLKAKGFRKFSRGIEMEYWTNNLRTDESL